MTADTTGPSVEPPLPLEPVWMNEWPWTAPRPSGSWTVGNGRGFGVLDPEAGTVCPIDPADDRKLPGIAVALDRGGEVVSYRHHRRAVVNVDGSFIKVVRPSRTIEVAERHRAMSGADGFDSPDVIAATDDGLVCLSTVDGRSLHDQLRLGGELPLDRIAAALVDFHSSASRVVCRTAATLDAPERWIETVARIEPAARRELQLVAATLPEVDMRGDAIVHTDLHDKNLMLTSERIGIIDLDGIATGPPELDVANLAVHLELRAIQAGVEPSAGRRHAAALLTEYDIRHRLDVDRMFALECHTWFRLACLYRCRRAGRSHVASMLGRATRR